MRSWLALILLLLSPTSGWSGELKFSTWNLDWLTQRTPGDPALPGNVHPRNAEDFARLRRYVDILDADVVALSEIDGYPVAARLFPPQRYTIHLTDDHVVQRTGFAIRAGLHVTVNPDLRALDLYPNAKYPLRSGADVTLDLPAGKLRVLAVHLKSGCRDAKLDDTADASCRILEGQLPPLRKWIADRQAEGVAFVVLGDFNRWMDGDDAFWAALRQTAPLTRATAGHYSPCWGGSGFIDHIIAGAAARDWIQADTLRVLVYRETGPDWRNRLSDHCPVSVSFHIPD